MSLYVVSVCYFSVAVSTVTYGVCFLRDKGVACRAHAGKKNSLVFLLWHCRLQSATLLGGGWTVSSCVCVNRILFIHTAFSCRGPLWHSYPSPQTWSGKMPSHVQHWKLLPVVDCSRYWFSGEEAHASVLEFHSIISDRSRIVLISIFAESLKKDLIRLTACGVLQSGNFNSVQVGASTLFGHVCVWVDLLERVWLQLHLRRCFIFSEIGFHFLKVCAEW